MPPVIVGVAVGFAATAVVSTAAAIAIGIGAAALTFAVTPQVDAGGFANEAYSQQQTIRSPTEARRGIYGKAMVSGPLVFAEETGTDNEYLHLVIPLAGHRCTNVDKVYFGDELAYDRVTGVTSKYRSHARVHTHLGDQTAADNALVSECRAWTNQHIGYGVTYVYVRLKHDQEVFTNGLPNIKCLVTGKPVYDPRKDSTKGGAGLHRQDEPHTWEYSDNWALCLLDYTRFESGIGALNHEIYIPSYVASANASDEQVEYKAGEFESRYTCNGTYTQKSSPASIVEKMLTAGAGMQVYVGGQYHLYAGVYQGPEVLTLSEADCAGDIEIRPYTPRQALCNAVRGTFVDPENYFQPTDFPPYESDYYKAQDNNEYIDHDIDLPFTQSIFAAQRLAKLHIELNRAGMQVSFPANMIGLAVSVGKVVRLKLDELSIDGTFLITDWGFDYGKPVKLIMRETTPAIFDYAMGSYTQRDLAINTYLPDPTKVPTPKNLHFTSMEDDDNWQGELQWDAPGNNSAYDYQLQITDSADKVVYQAMIDTTRYYIPKLDAGNYNIKLWAVNLFANRSNTPAIISTNATTPPPVAGIGFDAGALDLTLRPLTSATIAQTTQFEVKGSLSTDIGQAQSIGNGKEVVWPNRQPNTLYQVWARSTNNYGQSEWFGPVPIRTSSDSSAIETLLEGTKFEAYTWFAWADDDQGAGFTTDEAQKDSKAFFGIATEQKNAQASGNWQEYTWQRLRAKIGDVFSDAERQQLDDVMNGVIPGTSQQMLSAQAALNNPSLNNDLMTALDMLNNGINAGALGGETPLGAQAKIDTAKQSSDQYAEATAGAWRRSYSVNTSTWKELLYFNGGSLPKLYPAAANVRMSYTVTMVTIITGTISKTVGNLSWNGAGWEWELISALGTNFNHPAVVIDNNIPKVRTFHSSTYRVNVSIVQNTDNPRSELLNHTRLQAVNDFAVGNFTAQVGLIQQLIASQALFDQVQAQLGVFGGLAAEAIAAKAITTDKLHVLSRNLVNNFSVTGETTGWTGDSALVDHNHNGQIIKAMEVSSSGNRLHYSEWFNIDHTKVYEVNFTFHRVSGGNIGSRYFGMAAENSVVDIYHSTSRAPAGATSNFYFWSGDVLEGGYRTIKAYIIGSEVDANNVPETPYPICKLRPGCKRVRLRALNYYNVGTTTVDRWINPSVTELGSGTISARQLVATSGLFDILKAQIGKFGGLTANELQVNTALINKLVGTSALFDTFMSRLANFGGLTANSIAAGAIQAQHIAVGQKITSPIMQGGQLRLIGSAYMKVQTSTPFGPDGLVEWYGPKLLSGSEPNWNLLRKSNAITYLSANGDAYFGGSLSAGVLKTAVTNTTKTVYSNNSYPVLVGPFGTNRKSKVVVVSFNMNGTSHTTGSGAATQPRLQWQLQRKIGSGGWATVSNGLFTGTTNKEWDPEYNRYLVFERISGSSTYTDNHSSSSDFSYRVKVISQTRYHSTDNTDQQELTLISTEQ